MEAMVFLTIVFLGIEKSQRRPLDRQTIKLLVGKVRVYGDDIIIPVDYVRTVVPMLETFGFRVNRDKSFWTGKFRESCGRDYYDGDDVSIVKVRQKIPTRRQDATGIISTVSLRNQLFQAGCWQTVKWLDGIMSDMLRHYPDVAPTSPVLGRHTSLHYQVDSMHATLHSPLVKGWVISSKIPSDPLDGAGALLKYFVKRGGQPSVDTKHLERSGRPQRVDIKLRKRSPF
jgi:hypothetical protein